MCVRINPSILSADFVNFESEVAQLSSCDMVHVDIMDNHFVPNLTFGIQTVTRLAEISPRPLDVHLMIENVDRWAVDFAIAGAAMVTFHAEATSDPAAVASQLRKQGARAGLALKPNTALVDYLPLLQHFDQLLIMTVEPGFGGQKLIPETLNKVRAAREYLDTNKLSLFLQVDGGIDETNIAQVASAGADTFVAGSAIFKNPNRNEQIEILRTLAEAAKAK